MEDILKYEIIPFLEEDTNAIITIDLQTLGDRALLMQELRIILANTPRFTSRILRINDDRWANYKEWPTIQAMRDSDQRVIILSDSTIVKSHDNENIVWHRHNVDKSSRAEQKKQKPCVLWFTGLSGAGKSTVAGALENRLVSLAIILIY